MYTEVKKLHYISHRHTLIKYKLFLFNWDGIIQQHDYVYVNFTEKIFLDLMFSYTTYYIIIENLYDTYI